MSWLTRNLRLDLAKLPVVLRAATLVLAGAGVDDLALNNAIGAALGAVLQVLLGS